MLLMQRAVQLVQILGLFRISRRRVSNELQRFFWYIEAIVIKSLAHSIARHPIF